MIRKLVVKNFRCYENCTFYFKGSSVLVGKNNAGKSTLIEALKIISSVTRKYKSLRFVAPPYWVKGCDSYGVAPNVENMNIADHGMFYLYGDPPAIVEASFSNGTSIKAYLGDNLSVFALLFDENGEPVQGNRSAKLLDIPTVEVLPQISAVLDNEKVIKKSTVDGNRSTRLASRNFRNQLFYYQEAFPAFKELVESTWDSLQINRIESVFENEGQILKFYVRVGMFEAEIGWMGHGLQMWVQTMWFISQCPNDAVVVLDEPDVYMHADLQRRLVRLVSPMFKQLIIATHSLEIIEEVSSDGIIPIDSSKRQIRPIGDNGALSLLAEELGSCLNIDLARLFISNRFVFWDGGESDRMVLSAFQSVLYPHELHSIVTYPKAYLGGWNGWEKAVAISDVFSVNDLSVRLFGILNPGIHTTEEIKERYGDAKAHNIRIHVWEKCEMDNYAINVNVICRYLAAVSNGKKVEEHSVVEKVKEIIAAKYKLVEVELNSNMSIREDPRFDDPLNVVSGKAFFKSLSMWTRKEFGVSISAKRIVPYFLPGEVPEEVRRVVNLLTEKF